MRRTRLTLALMPALLCLFCGSIAQSASERVFREIPVSGGRTVKATIRIPENARSPVPALMLFGGFESAAQVLDLLPDDVPFALASFDYPFDGDRTFRFPATFFELPALRRSMNDTLDGISALRQTLARMPGIDPNRIGIIGASFGSPFAIVAASRDKQISPIIIIHGFVDLNDTIEHRLKQIFARRTGPLDGAAAWIASRAITLALSPPDAERAALSLGAEQKVLVIEAADDEFIPESARQDLMSRLEKSPASIWRVVMKGGHLQPGAHSQIQAILEKVLTWLR